MRTLLRPFFFNAGQASSLSLFKSRQAGSLSCIVAITLIGFGLFGCAPQKEEKILMDQSLAAFQTDLLQTAFDLATVIPLQPHIKDRARTQEKVVAACLELDQPQRSVRYIEEIPNWRRGLGYANAAFYSAEHDVTNFVAQYLTQAEELASLAAQDWRRNLVLLRAEQTRMFLSLPGAEIDLTFDEQKLNEYIAELDAAASTEDFDLLKYSLFSYSELIDRFYDRETFRVRMTDAIKNSWSNIPYTVRIDLLLNISEISLEHDDAETAMERVEDARAMVTDVEWPVEYRVPLMARVAEARFRCGDEEKALFELDEALVLYNEKEAEIINIYRAESLTPVAEGFMSAGHPEQARSVYKQAVETAVVNINSTPRAEDLSAICLSMALHQCEPDEALWTRICELQANLRDPW